MTRIEVMALISRLRELCNSDFPEWWPMKHSENAGWSIRLNEEVDGFIITIRDGGMKEFVYILDDRYKYIVLGISTRNDEYSKLGDNDHDWLPRAEFDEVMLKLIAVQQFKLARTACRLLNRVA